jgi:hypothetical protein
MSAEDRNDPLPVAAPAERGRRDVRRRDRDPDHGAAAIAARPGTSNSRSQPRHHGHAAR